MPVINYSCKFIAPNVRRTCAGGPIMASPVFSASAGLSPERAEVAMCKAISIKSIQKLYTWLPRTSSEFGITRFPLAYCGCCASVNLHATIVFFSGMLIGTTLLMASDFLAR